MAKVRVMPASASAATTSGWTSKSLNSGAVSSTGAPPGLDGLRDLLGVRGAGLGVVDVGGGGGVLGGVLGGGQCSRLWSAGGAAGGRRRRRPGAPRSGVADAFQRRRGQRTGARSAPGDGPVCPDAGSSGVCERFVSAQIPADLAARLFPW
jgi:hypothetical protein